MKVTFAFSASLILVLAVLAGWAPKVDAGHELGQDCYVCHNIRSGQVYQGSHEVWTGQTIGMPSYLRPITCDFCHTNYRGLFTGAASNLSKHPVRIISGTSTVADNTLGTLYGTSPAYIDCKNCHNGNTFTGNLIDLNPDVSPTNYIDPATGNTPLDGYPNHDNTITGYTILMASWDNQNVVTSGTEPHLSGVYNKKPSSTPATDYAFCFLCHNGTAWNGTTGTNRLSNIQADYTTGAGHFYKSGAPTGGNLNDRMACSDCHASHASNSSRLYRSVKGSSLAYSNPVTPTGPDIRSICNDCHADYGTPGSFTSATPTIRGVRPLVRPNTVAEHQASNTTSCTTSGCHKAHDAPAKCNACHGDGTLSSGAPPLSPTNGNRIWPQTVDNNLAPAGLGNHRSYPSAGVNQSGHDPFMGSTSGCPQCHTATPGSGATHNQATNTNAAMDNIVAHAWYTGAAASWSKGTLDGAPTAGPGSVVDDSCSNIDCHSPFYGSPANQYKSGTPTPYSRYWINQTLWDCYTCHPYDGRTATTRPGGPDNTMSTGIHTKHVGTIQMACSRCHNVTGYSTGTFTGGHKNGYVNWSFAGSPNPSGSTPSYSFADNTVAPTDDNAAAGHRSWGTCQNLYCHGTVQASPPNGGTGVVYATPAWDNAASGQCGTCHAGDGVSGNLTKIATGSHADHLPASYNMPCDVCHTGAGTNRPNHADGIIQVPIGDNSWHGLTLTGATTIYDRAASPGIDNANKLPGAAYGRCSSIPCHSDGYTGTPRINPALWGDNQAATRDCTYCHGGNRTSLSPIGSTTGSPTHLKHINANLACGKCHSGTVAPAADNVITIFDNHVNGIKNVYFPAGVNGNPYDNLNKTCSATYCHGTPSPPPKWDNAATVAGCSVCHQSNGAGNVVAYTGAHQKHTDNTTYTFACEICHANRAGGGHANATHAGGAFSAPQTAEVLFTDNASNQVYNGRTYVSRNMFTNPFLGAAVTDNYATGALAGSDGVNASITWSSGQCTNVWCHSNANPLGWKGTAGTNSYRTQAWAGSVGCAGCHRGADNTAAMTGTDNLSNAHITHVALDKYRFTCDECHALTVPNDCTTTLIPGGAHLNGVKSVKFGTTLRTTTVDQSGGTYDNSLYHCNTTYCHSNGTTTVAPFGAPVDNTISWNSATGGTCVTCHGGNKGSTTPIATGSHTKHIASYKCSACHSLTVAASSDNVINASTGYANHVNGVKTVQAGDNNTFSYTAGTPGTCLNISCHGNNTTAASWGGTLGCQDCHGGASDVNDYAYNNGIMAKVQMSGGWDNTGHGRIGSNYVSGNPPANDNTRFGSAATPNCVNFCHDAIQPHVDNTTGNNFFRLATGQGGTRTAITHSTANDVCRQCHDTAYGGSFQAQATRKVGTAHYGSRHSDPNYNGGAFCWDCHDPHGEPNDYMIQGSVVARNDNATGGIGIPLATAAVTFNRAGASYTGTDYVKAGFNGLCQACHNPATGIAHFNTSTYDSSHNLGTRCTQCHTHNSNFEAKCVDCHRDTGKLDNNAPTVVWPGGNRSPVPSGTVQGSYGSHLVGQKNDPAFGASTDWNAQCNKCHSGHGGAVQVPMPPTSWTDPSGRLTGTNMAQRIGLDNYAVDNGIRLGGSATAGATEAEICWNCHGNAANNVSEWGPGDNNVALAGFPVVKFPTQHDGTPNTFDYGWIYTDNTFATKTADWTVGFWRDEYSWGTDNGSANLKRRIVSVHTASFDPAGQSSSVAANVKADNTINYASPILENRSYIRCSYCHDVHDLNRAVDPFNTTVKEAKSGPPYLRGTFISNPYPPDMTPRGTPGQGGNTYPTTGGPTQGTLAVGNRFRANTGGQVFPDATPRLFAFTYTTISKGGFFIDLNSGNPTTGQTYQGTAGLCALCHATNVDTMKFYTGSNLWAKTNGHSNASLGGTGTNAAELFDARRLAFGSPSNATGKYMEMQDGINVTQWGINVGYNSGDQTVGANWNVFGAPQPCNSGGANCPPKNSGWYGGTAGSQTQGANYAAWYGGTTPPKPAHTYTCSKCHKPHASGLPALLATNCLDIGLSNWSANGGRVGPNNGTGLGSRGPANCHRKTATEQGWNRLAPKQTQ